MRYDEETATEPKRNRVVWTPEEDLILMDAKERGVSYSEVLDRLPGRTRSAVAGRYARLEVRALPYEERVRLRKLDEQKYPRKPRPPQRQNGGRKPSLAPARLSAQTPVKARSASFNNAPRRSVARASLLPHVTVKGGTLVHVYKRDPYALQPIASFEKRSSDWVQRGNESARFKSVADAVRSMESPW